MRSLNPGSAVLAGLAGTAVMTILMYAAPLVGLPPMDIMGALGSLAPGAPIYLVGAFIHFGIGVTLAILYALLFASRLPGPGWLRGALFSLLPWLFAITLMAPTMAAIQSVLQPGAQGAQAALPANPCAASPANPCGASRPVARPSPSNPSARPANPCDSTTAPTNPCAVAGAPGTPGGSPAAPGPWTVRLMSLANHLVFGALVGALYRRRQVLEEAVCSCC